MLRPDVPVMNSRLDAASRASLLAMAREANAARVWIALSRVSLFDRGDHIERLRENLRFFEENGIETGVWFQAFGFGEPLSYDACGWTRLCSVTGKCKEIDAFCPEDPDFCDAFFSLVRDIAELSPALMMMDDDLCLSVRPGIGCFCERHLKLLRDEVGELPSDLTSIFTGGKNKYRDAWYRVMGNTLRGFCRRARETVDAVDPSIRLGFCAGYTSWDIEGTDPIELSKILAGNTRPFYRMTGAPYWVAKNRFPGQRLSAIVENARNQLAWSRDEEIEIFAEADSYPRPCYHTPAMLIENFDLAMHASGIRSLKYLFDYYSTPEYETRYLKIHKRNLPLYEAIEEAFRDTTPVGIRVYRPPHRITDAILPEQFAGEKPIMRSYFSNAAAMLASHAIPVSYTDGGDCAVVFGDDALYFDGAPKRVVLDRTAALLLKERGIDVGIASCGASAVTPTFELFDGEKVLLQGIDGDAEFCDLHLKDGATVVSRFDTGIVASFAYGDYLILNFDAFSVNEASTLYCSYARGKELQEFFGAPYPTVSECANLYSICAEGENRHAVLLQNLSIDPVFDLEITLPRPAARFTLTGGEGVLLCDRIRVTTDFLPQATMLLSVEYEGEEG